MTNTFVSLSSKLPVPICSTYSADRLSESHNIAERSSLERTSSMVTSMTAVSSQTGFRSPRMIRVE